MSHEKDQIMPNEKQ